MPNEDLELVRQLRVEWRNAYDEAQKQRDTKGYVDSEVREKLEKTDAALNKKTDEALAANGALTKRVDEQQTQIRGLMEKSSRPPGAELPPGFETRLSLGRKFVDHEAFKGADKNQRLRVSVTLEKTRFSDLGMKATTIIEGGPTPLAPPAGNFPVLPYFYGLYPQRFAPLTMRALCDVVPLDGTNSVEYVTEVWTNAADYQVLEGDLKARSGVVYTDHNVPVRTIAHFTKASRQMAADVPAIMTMIENRLALGVLLKEDKEILYGDNTAGHLWGIMPQAQVLAGLTTQTAIDEILLAIAAVENAFYMPTNIVMNPVTWATMEAQKNTQGSYLLAGPMGGLVPRIWGLPVTTTPQINAGDYLVGAFPGNVILFDRETVTVELAYQNEDDFVRNLITIRGEERVCLAVLAPKAFNKGPFKNAPVVLTTTEAEKTDNGPHHTKK